MSSDLITVYDHHKDDRSSCKLLIILLAAVFYQFRDCVKFNGELTRYYYHI